MSHIKTVAEYTKDFLADPIKELELARKAKIDINTHFSRSMENRQKATEPRFACERILAEEKISMVDVPGERDSSKLESFWASDGLRIAYMVALKNSFYRGIEKGINKRATVTSGLPEGTDLNPVDIAPYEFVTRYAPQIPINRLAGNVTFTPNRKVEVAKVLVPATGFWKKVDQLEPADITKIMADEDSKTMGKQIGAFLIAKEAIEAGMTSQMLTEQLNEQRSILLIQLTDEIGTAVRENAEAVTPTVDISDAEGIASIYSLLDSPYQGNTVLANKSTWNTYVGGLLKNNALRHQGRLFNDVVGSPELLNSGSSIEGIGYLDNSGFVADHVYIYDYRNAFDLRVHNDNVLEEREYRMESQGWFLQLSFSHALRVRDTNSIKNVTIS